MKNIFEEIYISATDIKNWVYCPLIVYYRKILKAKPKTESQQEAGKDKHKIIQEKIARRRSILARIKNPKIIEKDYQVEIINHREKLVGVIDILAKGEDGEIIPIEIKTTQTDRGRAWKDHIIQLTFYAYLLQKTFKKQVKRGYIYYTPENILVEVAIDGENKRYVKNIIAKIREMLEKEKMPKTRVSKRKCTGGCGYKWICLIR